MTRKGELRDHIENSFDLDELHALCFDLDINFENLPGDTLSAKSRALVSYCQRSNRLNDLVSLCSKKRPLIDWPNIVDNTPKASPEELVGKIGGGEYIEIDALYGEITKWSYEGSLNHPRVTKWPLVKNIQIILTNQRFILLPKRNDGKAAGKGGSSKSL